MTMSHAVGDAAAAGVRKVSAIDKLASEKLTGEKLTGEKMSAEMSGPKVALREGRP